MADTTLYGPHSTTARFPKDLRPLEMKNKAREMEVQLNLDRAAGLAATAELVEISGAESAYSGDNAFTDNVAFDLFTLPLAAAEGVAIEVVVSVFQSDGTDHQVITVPALIKAVNKAGTFTVVVTEEIGDLVAASSGTLTLVLAAAEGAANVLDVSMTANTSLTATVSEVSWTARVIAGGASALITKVNADS